MKPMPPGPSLDQIRIDVDEWQVPTFPSATPHGAAAHLRKEAIELYGELWEPAGNQFDGDVIGPLEREIHTYDRDLVRMEMADIFFMLVQLERTTGINLAQAVADKLKINEARAWGEPNEQGVVEHVRGDDGAE